MENTENIVPENQTEDTTQSWSFVTDEEAAAGMAAQQQAAAETQEPQVQTEAPAETPAETPVETPAEAPLNEPQVSEHSFDATTDDFTESPSGGEDYSTEDIDSAIAEYLSEKLGREIGSIDDFIANPSQNSIDEGVEAIAKFVRDTGRSPQEWFMYQQLNPSEMDDVTAIQVDMSAQYPNLSQSEVNLLIKNKYNADPDNMSEEQLNYVRLQVKLDAEKARKSIEDLRSGYMAPAREYQEDGEDLFDEQWISSVRQSVDDFQGIEFDLGNEKTFKFGIGDQYKATLAEKQARLDEYFDPYVREDGSWDYDTLNMHRTILDNFETIAKSIYQQGMSDGKRGIVDQAANVSIQSPNQGSVPETNSLSQQLREALSDGGGMRINL
jgi:hypothetical protein